MRDRFKVIHTVVLALIRNGEIPLATVAMEELALGHPPLETEPHEFYRTICDLLDSLRPVGAEHWACDVSPDGFCHHDKESAGCKHCGEPVERI